MKLPRATIRGILLALAAAAVLAAFWARRTAAPGRPWNVVVVLVDTLRADHLSAYGYPRSTSPAFDAFAGRAVLFENARSQSACTFPSVNSLLTSRHPLEFLGQDDGRIGIPAAIPSLAEILRRRGYRTAAVSASGVVRRSASRFNPHGGYDRGFELFDEECNERNARCVNRVAFRYLDQWTGEAPFFLYLHYFDPHAPYRPPRWHEKRFGTHYQAREPKRYIRRGDTDPIAVKIYNEGLEPELEPADVQFLIDLYDDEIAFFDAQFRALLEELEARRLEDSTVLAFLSDHGEAFLEHGDINHCRDLWESKIKVPFALFVPGIESARLRVAAQNLDLVPTLLDYLSIAEEDVRFDGRSLRPVIEARSSEPGGHYAFAFQGPYRMVSDGRFKLLYDAATRELRLFDLLDDPQERRDVRPTRGGDFRRLRRVLFDWLRQHEQGTSSPRSLEAAREAEERLRTLGYIP